MYEGRSPLGRRGAVRTHWGQSVQVDSRVGSGGPRRPPRGAMALRYLSTAPGGNGEVGAMRAVKVGGDEPADPPSRRALPGRPGAGRDALPAEKVRPAGAQGSEPGRGEGEPRPRRRTADPPPG